MMQITIENIQEQDMKILKPLFTRMGITYTQKIMKEVEDHEALKKLDEWKKSPVLSKKETKEALKKAGVF